MTKHKITAIVVMVALVLCMIPTVSLAATGDTYSDGTFNYTELADGTLSVTGYVGGGGAVVIPSSYDPGSGSMAVTAIGASAFVSNNTITSVTIPYGVTTIGVNAFRNCDAMNSITVPASVTSIGDYAVAYCDGLSSVTLSEGLSVIGGYMFYSCSTLGSITIPSSVTAIGINVFGGCNSLSSATLSEGLSVIGQNMFYNLDALTSITIPSSVTSVGSSAFMYCDGLTSVTLSEGLTVIGTSMFRECDALPSVTIPSSVTFVGSSAFSSCEILGSVTLSEGLTTIGDNMFNNCDTLTSITIPSSVTSVGLAAFLNCDNLGSVTLSDGLDVISDFAFYDCPLTSITLPSSVTLVGANAFLYCPLTKAVIHNKTVTLLSNCLDNTNLSADGIYGFAGSTAQTYATDNSIPFHAFVEVTYDSQGGSAVPSDYVVNSGETVDAPDAPTWDGHNFGGWYPTQACDTTAITFPYVVTVDATLYAKWTVCTYTVEYNANGGSGTTASSSYTYDVSKTLTANGFAREYYTFAGWATSADGAVVYSDEESVSNLTSVNNDTVTLYAVWTAVPELSSSIADGTIYTGGRITLTPNLGGGEWDWDHSFFTATFNSPATFTALKAGTSTITYTVGGVTVSYEVTIEEAELPATGQDLTWVWVLIGAAVMLALAVAALSMRRKEKNR